MINTVEKTVFQNSKYLISYRLAELAQFLSELVQITMSLIETIIIFWQQGDIQMRSFHS